MSDASQAGVPAAPVQASDPARNIQVRAVTDAAGRYALMNLPPGRYTLTIEMNGLKKAARENLELQINQDASLDNSPPVGGVQDSIGPGDQPGIVQESRCAKCMGQCQ